MDRIVVHKRLRIGLIFTGSIDWVGGLYYIHNIIRSLKELPEEKKPFLLIIPDWGTPKEYISSLGYPYANILSPDTNSLLKRSINRIFKAITARNRYYDWMTSKFDLQWLYPFHDFRPEFDSVNDKKISWIYDFQHKLLPELFTKDEIKRRESEFSLITSKSRRIVVSSNDSLNQLKRFYPHTKASIVVLQFVSVIDTEKITSLDSLREKYSVQEPYFIVSNQFWQHKNHLVILESLRILKDRGRRVMVVFTGKESDHRNPGYFQSLKDFVSTHELGGMTQFLGFISRDDQLGLMKNAIAVIQPSRFEGWGTVVEDAKTLVRPVILSDIPVHREQMDDRGYFFSPDKALELANLLEEFLKPGFIPLLPDDKHKERLVQFAENFLNIFKF
jgi:glycosyltransferase involved in cell wall biosynthesis